MANEEHLAILKQGVSPQIQTRPGAIEMLTIYAHEADRERDPAEAYVDYGR